MPHSPFSSFPIIAQLQKDCDYQGECSVEGKVRLEDFIAKMFGTPPAWIQRLFTLRGWIAKFLGLKHELGKKQNPPPEFHPNGKVSFFSSIYYEQGIIWIGKEEDKHLSSWVAIMREPIANEHAKLHILTIVRYNNRLGFFYFNFIKPFHKKIVKSMACKGVAG